MSLGAAGRNTAEAYLQKQMHLADLQMVQLRQQEHFEKSHLHWRRFNDRMKGALQIIGVLVGLTLVAVFAAAVWNAAHSEGFVIESFAVPPDLAVRGLTGEVVANRLLDRLNVVQTPAPNSTAAAQNASTGVSDDVKVEIPETGVSVGELYRFLRRWLGHETHVSGEVVRQDKTLTVGVRVNGKDGASYEGAESDLDALLQKAAEHVYEIALPTGFAANIIAVFGPARQDEARDFLQHVTADPAATPRQRAAAWNGLNLIANREGDFRAALALLLRVQQADPSFAQGFSNAVGTELNMGHVEAALALSPRAGAAFERDHDGWSKVAVIGARASRQMTEAELHGDYAGAVSVAEAAAAAMGGGNRQYLALVALARDRARLHDGGAPAWLAQQPQPVGVNPTAALLLTPFNLEFSLEHWPSIMAVAGELESAYARQPGVSAEGREQFVEFYMRPSLALAKAETGDIPGAETLIAQTPGDCYHCVRFRGLIASDAKEWGRADYWFAKAVTDAPSIPLAHEDWGRSFLARGKPDEAIAQFTLANQKGPHFADPLEGWGEALIAKNQSHMALAKFVEAEKYAPNWGRLHLKWGEALVWAGKKDEAVKQFVRANALDLTPSERSELMRVSHG